jgi:hypothetical protein
VRRGIIDDAGAGVEHGRMRHIGTNTDVARPGSEPVRGRSSRRIGAHFAADVTAI